MKRYRNEDASLTRHCNAHGYGFRPTLKRGKRAKRQFAKDMQEALTALDDIATHVKAMSWDELYALAVTAHNESLKGKHHEENCTNLAGWPAPSQGAATA